MAIHIYGAAACCPILSATRYLRRLPSSSYRPALTVRRPQRAVIRGEEALSVLSIDFPWQPASSLRLQRGKPSDVALAVDVVGAWCCPVRVHGTAHAAAARNRLLSLQLCAGGPRFVCCGRESECTRLRTQRLLGPVLFGRWLAVGPACCW